MGERMDGRLYRWFYRDTMARAIRASVSMSFSKEKKMSNPGDDHPFGFALDEMDGEAFENMRDWLERALVAHGATRHGGGIGFGQADLDIELEGQRYNVSIRPLPAPPEPRTE